MNFQVGWPHWWLVIISGLLLFVSKIKKSTKVLAMGIIGVFIFSVFMTHNKSTFIWIHIGLLKYFQFPWRFLSLSIFTASLLGGFVIYTLKEKWQLYAASAIIVLSIILNQSYFKPKLFYSVSDSEKLSGELWDMQKKGAVLDYLPKTALEPREVAPEVPIVRSGSAEVTNFINRSNRWGFNTNVKNKAEIEIPVYYFPNWRVKVDGRQYPFSYNNLLGRISLILEQGNYKVEGHFEDTPVRKIANVITVISAIGLVFYINERKK
jgi:hypothetical protein